MNQSINKESQFARHVHIYSTRQPVDFVVASLLFEQGLLIRGVLIHQVWDGIEWGKIYLVIDSNKCNNYPTNKVKHDLVEVFQSVSPR